MESVSGFAAAERDRLETNVEDHVANDETDGAAQNSHLSYNALRDRVISTRGLDLCENGGRGESEANAEPKD